MVRGVSSWHIARPNELITNAAEIASEGRFGTGIAGAESGSGTTQPVVPTGGAIHVVGAEQAELVIVAQHPRRTLDELGELSHGEHGVVTYDTSHWCGAPPGAACAPQGRAWG
jgi:hypothetical protein